MGNASFHGLFTSTGPSSTRFRPRWVSGILAAAITVAGFSGRTSADEPVAKKAATVANDVAVDEGHDEPIVTVLGKPILRRQLVKEATTPRKQAIHLCHLVYSRLQPHYAKAKGILPTDEEVELAMERYLKKANESGHHVTKEQIQQIVDARPEMMQLFPYGQMLEWKTSKSLWKEHGGNVGISAFGMCLPFEGRLALFKKYHAAGDIKFHDEEFEKQFWAVANDVNDKNHSADGVLTDQERIAKYFAKKSPWEPVE